MKLKIILLITLVCTTLFASANNNFILEHNGLIDKRAQDKILEIGLEVKSKLGVNIYTYTVDDNGINLDLPRKDRINMMKQFERDIINSLDVKKSYAIILIVAKQQHANILISNDIKNLIDKDDILDGYIILLLASKDKNSLFAKTSAAILNGYAQVADSIAAKKNIKLVSSIGSTGKTASTIWKVFMYSLVLFGIVAYTIIILRERKAKKNAK